MPSGLVEPRPAFAVENKMSGDRANTIPPRHFSLRFLRAKFPYVSDILFRQFRTRMASASIRGAMHNFISLVFSFARPPQVMRVYTTKVAIPTTMGRLWPILRRWPIHQFTGDSVGVRAFALVINLPSPVPLVAVKWPDEALITLKQHRCFFNKFKRFTPYLFSVRASLPAVKIIMLATITSCHMALVTPINRAYSLGSHIRLLHSRVGQGRALLAQCFRPVFISRIMNLSQGIG